MLQIRTPYLIFLGDAHDQLAGKTGVGIAEWRRDWCVGQLRLPGCQADAGLADLTLEQAAEQGAKTLLIGTTVRGGRINEAWQQLMVRALELGMDIASGLHDRVGDLPAVREAAALFHRTIHDVRTPEGNFPIGTGIRRAGKRVLTVGTDCSIGKMYTGLALDRDMKAGGMNATFRATGQTGILIAGSGIPLDAVVADFIAGAVEMLCPANAPDHWDVVEGQATVLHPSYAGVTVGLVMGAQPDALVMVHAPDRPTMRGLGARPVPGIAETIAAHEACARITNPAAKVIGISLNTSKMDEGAAMAEIARTADRFGMPTIDPARTGCGLIVDVLKGM
ncbi:N-acetyltransferase DgcN [Elioraea sp.]|uniref:N-acetyltransferase DgcN n=1 Tax=Elioraea sp. TaxID=2185103 RepID=UPI003459D094